MHPIARFALAAPLALALAACGETTDVDDRVVQTGGVEPPADVRLPQVDVEYPQVPLDARGTVDYVGTYELRTADDQVSTIALAADDTYTWTAPDGTETSGSFTWGEDGSRILIERNGAPQAYAVADGVLYTLPTADAPVDGERSAATTWRRSDPTPTDGNQADVPPE